VAHAITLIPGDGIGPEVSTAAREVIAATGIEVDGTSRRRGPG